MKIKEQIEIECDYVRFKEIVNEYEKKGYVLATFVSWAKINPNAEQNEVCRMKFEKENENE